MLRLAIAAMILLWAASIFLPVWHLNGETTRGYDLLFTAWMGPLGGRFEWYANPMLWAVGLLGLTGRGGVTVWSLLAVGLVACFLSTAALRSVVANEAGMSYAIDHRFAGFYLWMSSVALAAIIAGFRLQTMRNAA